MNVEQLLRLNIFAGSRLVAGQKGLHREVRWLHVVDIPDPLTWVREQHLLLTTGYAWPRDEQEERQLIRELAENELTGVGLAVPQFFERFSEASREEANTVGLPLIEVPWEIPFAQISEEALRAILASQYEEIARAQEIHKALIQAAADGVNLQQLAETFAGLTHRDVIFEGTEGMLLAASTQAGAAYREAGQRSRDPSAAGPVPGPFGDQGLAGGFRQRRSAIRVPALGEPGLPAQVICPIRPGGEYAGLVRVIEGESPLTEAEIRATEQVAVVAALRIAHQRELAHTESRLGHTFLDALIEGRFSGSAAEWERAQLMGFDADTTYRVGVLLLDEELPLSRHGLLKREDTRERLRCWLDDLGVPPILSASLNRVIFLLPQDIYPRVFEMHMPKGAMLALGGPREGFEGVNRSHSEALSVLRSAQGAGVHRHEDYLIPLVLEGDREAQDHFIHHLLGEIRQARGGDKIIETLLTWARCGFSQRKAASTLGVHQNTLRYRLNRATEIADLKLPDPELRFQLQLAARLLTTDRNAPAIVL